MKDVKGGAGLGKIKTEEEEQAGGGVRKDEEENKGGQEVKGVKEGEEKEKIERK